MDLYPLIKPEFPVSILYFDKFEVGHTRNSKLQVVSRNRCTGKRPSLDFRCLRKLLAIFVDKWRNFDKVQKCD